MKKPPDLFETNALQLITTGDGSHTLQVPTLNEHYHSTFGAIAESMHVFVKAGFDEVARCTDEVRLLEVGMGTGLNVLLTFIAAEKQRKALDYTAIEPYILPQSLLIKINYPTLIQEKNSALWWHRIHTEAQWNETCIFSDQWSLLKWKGPVISFPDEPKHHFNLIYFDAFAPTVQPELWETPVFIKLSAMMDPGGVLVTYSSRGSFRRSLASAGFRVTKIAGPSGKREMVSAIKL